MSDYDTLDFIHAFALLIGCCVVISLFLVLGYMALIQYLGINPSEYALPIVIFCSLVFSYVLTIILLDQYSVCI